MRADGGTVPLSTHRPRRGGGGKRRGVRLGPASETRRQNTRKAGRDRQDTGPATDDAPANRARGGEPHGRPRGGSRTHRRGDVPRERPPAAA
ncbi:hypothetical protein ACRRTK_010577 [Alexandromys fortis]